jgi:hypothetical protein
MWRCLECGRRFKTTRAAERAANEGCPGGGGDVDLDVGERPAPGRCLCGSPLGAESHNAAPVAKGRCCNKCHPKVLLERVRRASGQGQP